jgi:hypothetical protein
MDRANGLPLLLPTICHDLRGRALHGRVAMPALFSSRPAQSPAHAWN